MRSILQLSFVVAALICTLPNGSVQGAGALKIGGEVSGEIGGEKSWVTEKSDIGSTVNIPELGIGFKETKTIDLKAGDSVTIVANVVGKNRKVAIVVFDKTGKLIEKNGELTVKTAKLFVEEVSAPGKYTVIIHSDAVGLYSVKVAISDDETDVKALESKVKKLRKDLDDLQTELEEAEAKLKKAKQKSGSN